jgi:hypothetical protein
MILPALTLPKEASGLFFIGDGEKEVLAYPFVFCDEIWPYDLYASVYCTVSGIGILK